MTAIKLLVILFENASYNEQDGYIKVKTRVFSWSPKIFYTSGQSQNIVVLGIFSQEIIG